MSAGTGRVFVSMLLLGLAACSTLQRVEPTNDAWRKGVSDRHVAYSFESIDDRTSPDTLIVFAFSGGGIRSAAFGYGALKAAHAIALTRAGAQRSLSSEIDIVTGVSGGSFTAAAFASHGESLFPSEADGQTDYYRNNFLTFDMWREVIGAYLRPWNWMRSDWGINDDMALAYAGIKFRSANEALFGRDFGALGVRGRPFLVVQATDVVTSQPFAFTQNDFDLICSDVSSYPVANAVAASNGFPGLFSPVHITNHWVRNPGVENPRVEISDCPETTWLRSVRQDTRDREFSRRRHRAAMAAYLVPPRKDEPWDVQPNMVKNVHLFDGGIADNVAFRGLVNIVAQSLGDALETGWDIPSARVACAAGLGAVHRVWVVSVDGESPAKHTGAEDTALSNLLMITGSIYETVIESSGKESLIAAQALTQRLADRLEELRCPVESMGLADRGDVIQTPDTVKYLRDLAHRYAKANEAANEAKDKRLGELSKALLAQAQQRTADTTVRPLTPVQLANWVTGNFAHISFANLEATKELSITSCTPSTDCRIGAFAASTTSLGLSAVQADGIAESGWLAFFCNKQVRQFLVRLEDKNALAAYDRKQADSSEACETSIRRGSPR